MNRIPKVKTWIVTTIDGDQFEILAPTRCLAILNFRCEVGYAIIETVGQKKKVSETY